jgi:hypothetical protein
MQMLKAFTAVGYFLMTTKVKTRLHVPNLVETMFSSFAVFKTPNC